MTRLEAARLVASDRALAAARVLRQRWGRLEWQPGLEYTVGRRQRTGKPTIESRSGTVLLQAMSNADESDLRCIVEIVNDLIEEIG